MVRFSRSEEAFLELYRAGLWGTALDDSSFQDGEIDWERVVELAREQTLVGIIGDAMSQLPKGTIPRQQYLTLLKEVLEIEKANNRMNSIIPVLFHTIEHLGLVSWLIKGQGVGQTYLNPLRRQPGDIDVFFPVEAEFEKARAEFLNHPDVVHVHSDTRETKTLEFDSKGVYIELHGQIVTELNRRCHRNFHAFCQRVLPMPTSHWNGATLPPVLFDSVFIFVHMVRHYFGGGIGLRQVSDWMRYMHAHSKDTDCRQLRAALDDLGLVRLWQVFSSMAVETLGCPKECLFFYDEKYRHHGRRILRYILDSGNFGYYDERTKSTSRFYYVRRFRAFWGHLQMKFRNFTMFPEESLYGIPSFVRDGLART